MKIFLPRMAEMVMTWSERSGRLGYATRPTITDSLWDQAFKLASDEEFHVYPIGSTDLRLVLYIEAFTYT